jgi:hypothetical protein
MNVSKTNIFFSRNVTPSLARVISRQSGFNVNENLGKYVRVHLLYQRITKQTYNYLIEAMQKRLAN